MSSKIPVPVFDSSTIDIPNPPPIKFSSFEGQPLVAWRPSAKNRNRDTPTAERSTSKQGEGSRSPRDKSPDIVLEGRASAKLRSLDKNKRDHKSPKKWKEPSFDRRSKSILDILKTKRESFHQDTSKQYDQSNPYELNNGELTQDKVITYPKFIVREKKKNRKEKDQLVDDRTSKLAQTRPLKEDRIRDYFHSMDMAAYDQVDLQRAVDSRRSYRPKKVTRSALYEYNGTHTPKGKFSASNFGRYSGLDNGHDQSVDDLIMGFYPDEMQEGLQGKSMNNMQARPGSISPQKQRTNSPPHEHVPPPPTPASQLLMQFGVTDPNDYDRIEEEFKIEERLDRERRKVLRERTRNRDKTNGNAKRDQSDPGVSSTTHHLLEANIIRRQFVFPCLSPEARRKAVTSRVDDNQHMYRMTPGNVARSKSSMNAQNFYPVHPAAQVQSYDLNGREPDPPEREKSASKIDLSASHDQLPSAEPQRSHSSIGMSGGVTRSQSFYHGQKKSNKYARMISLGLPKVNIDIERNHFSQGNIVRRSLEMREKYQIPENTKDIKVGENGGFKYLKRHSNPEAGDDNDDRKSISSQISVGHMDSSGGGSGEIERLQFPVNDGNSTPETSSQLKFRPPPNTPIDGESSVFQRRSTIRKNSSKIPVKSKQGRQTPASKNTVGVSYFKMAPPGENNSDNVKNDHPKHTSGVIKTLEIEIAL